MGLCQAVPLRVSPTVSGQLALARFGPASGTEAQSRFCLGAPVAWGSVHLSHSLPSSPSSHHLSLLPRPVQMPLHVQFPEGEVGPRQGRAGLAKGFTALGQESQWGEHLWGEWVEGPQLCSAPGLLALRQQPLCVGPSPELGSAVLSSRALGRQTQTACSPGSGAAG